VTRLVLDTDIDTDCDDAGALAVLHGLAARGECELLGVIASVPVAACAPAVRAINAWYGRPDLPVGAVRATDYESAASWKPYRDHRAWFARGEVAGSYNEVLARSRPPGDASPEDAVALYRRLLASSPEGSVTICAIGTLTALAQLLDSGPDGASPLPGRELVRRFVRELVCMAVVGWPTGRDTFNWLMDLPAAAKVVRDWPTALTTSSEGARIRTGARFTAAAPLEHPVRTAYLVYLRGPGRSTPSWDQVAATYAVQGLEGPFARSGRRELAIDAATGSHRWLPWRGGPQRRSAVPLYDDLRMAAYIEDLMIG
jgi:inosine-uridine nucleoside N-ribohydrolase